MLFLALWLATLARADFAELSYEWVVEQGMAVGCIEKHVADLRKNGKCENLPFLTQECLLEERRYLISDKALCAKKMVTVDQWLDREARLCGTFAAVRKDGKDHKFLLGFADPTECGYSWLDAATVQGECYFSQGGRHEFHPLSNLRAEQLLPEILNLAAGGSIPPEVYEKADSRRLAANLAYKRRKENKKAGVAGNYDFLENSEIQMAFRHDYLDRILANGFLNQHQTRTSQGTLDLRWRAETEDSLAGHALAAPILNPEEAGNPKVNELRPKYAFFGITRPFDEAEANTFAYNGAYGNIMAVFKPEVKDRTTITAGDSLVNRSILALSSGDGRLATPGSADGKAKSNRQGYWEAQIWGELKVKEDVGYFLFGCFDDEKASKVTASPLKGKEREEVLGKLKATGKKVYQCEVDRLPRKGSPNPSYSTTNYDAPVIARFRKGNEL